jgi:hypothetical protein
MIPETSKVYMAFRKLSKEVNALTAGGMEFHIWSLMIKMNTCTNYFPDLVGGGATRIVGSVLDQMVHMETSK